MKLSALSIAKYIHGAVRIENVNGYLNFHRFSSNQEELIESQNAVWYTRTKETASIKFIAKTDATAVEVEYKLIGVSAPDTVEGYANGKLCFLTNLKNLAPVGKKGTLTLTFPQGEKEIEILLPPNANFAIRSITANGYIHKAKERKVKALWLGDSITQGYGALQSGEQYVEVVNRLMNYEAINQGLGGHIHDENMVVAPQNFTPDILFIAYGTNHYLAPDFEERVVKFYEKVAKTFADIPTVVITPLWRNDVKDDIESLRNSGEIIKKVASQYPNIKVFDGLEIVPNFNEYFLDGLHPNALGMRVYGYELARKIKQLKF